METMTQPITVQTTVNAPVKKVWEAWSEPKHITKWCQASDDWHAPKAENDLRTGGKFVTTMAAKDGSVSFDFGGVYSNVKPTSLIEYAMEDGRKVKVIFESIGDKTKVTETFDPESENSIELQRDGWQAILDNFKKYTESLR
ncbi:MAG TPA: SRPBCC family protein [Chryseosolibacter sp.]